MSWNIRPLLVTMLTLEPFQKGQRICIEKSRKSFKSQKHIDGLAQDCSNSNVNALELLPSCTKPSICALIAQRFIWAFSQPFVVCPPNFKSHMKNTSHDLITSKIYEIPLYTLINVVKRKRGITTHHKIDKYTVDVYWNVSCTHMKIPANIQGNPRISKLVS